MTEFRTLQPGLLVSMKTDLKGNVSYHDIDRDVRIVASSEITDIHTRKRIEDIEEHERAIKIRTKARGKILSVCSSSEFGLLCPNDREQDLRDAIAEARSLADDFNATAKVSRMSVNVIFGRIAQDDVEAVRAISGEIRQLMEDMRQGVRDLDVKRIRDAANKATDVGKMLAPETKGRTDSAIKAARTAARKIVKAGNQAAVEIDKADIAKINRARTMFLDIEQAASIAEPEMTGRAIDFDVTEQNSPKATARSIEIAS